MRVTLFVREFDDAFGRASLDGLREAAYSLFALSRDQVNTLYPPASKVGEPPRRRSGSGFRSIFAQAEMINGRPYARTGTSSERLVEQQRGDFNYMAYHETHKRPWLLPALTSGLPQIAAAFERGAGTL